MTREHPDPSTARCSCPCCGYATLQERGAYEICEVCFWEDDGQDDTHADAIRGGPNGDLSLSAARTTFAHLGACDPSALSHVRPPRPEEIPKGVLAGNRGRVMDGAGWTAVMVATPGSPEPLDLVPAIVLEFDGLYLVWAANHPGWWMGQADGEHSVIVCWGSYGCDLAAAVAGL